MRARTQRAIRIIAGVTLASAVFGAVISSFTPDGTGTGIFTGGVIGFVLSSLGLLMLGPWSDTLQRWPVAVVFLLRTLIYGFVFMLVPNAMSALVHGSLAPFRDPTRVVTGTTLALSALKRFSRLMDYAEYGGAPLLGLNGTVIVSHGASNQKAIANAVDMAGTLISMDAATQLKEGLAANKDFAHFVKRPAHAE